MGAELYHQQAARLEEAGIPVLPKPISKAMLQHSVRLLCTAQKRLYIAQRETMDLQQKMQEVRIIASAKRLMQNIRLGGRARTPLSAKAGHGPISH